MMDPNMVVAVLFRKEAQEEVLASSKYAELIDDAVNRLENSDRGDALRQKIYEAILATNKQRKLSARRQNRCRK